MMSQIKIMSMNCRGLGDAKKRRDVLHYIRNKKFDIVFLQDTHLIDKTIPYFDSLWHGNAYHSCFSSRSRGVSILISNTSPCSQLTLQKSSCGNLIFLRCIIDNESYLLVNVYGPNKDEPDFYKRLGTSIGKFDFQHIIVAGDFNFVMNPEKDSLNYINENNINAKQIFLEITDKHDMVDAWRHVHTDDRNYTWTKKTPFKAGRLDMFFVNEELLCRLTEAEIRPGYRTDHSKITMCLQTKQQRGSGLWKFNVSHLKDEEYIKRIKLCIRDSLQQYAIPIYSEEMYTDHINYEHIQLTIDECLFYETLIMMIRGETVQYSKQKAKRVRKEENEIEEKITKLQQNICAPDAQGVLNQIEILKNNLEELRQPMIEGIIIRSRVAWHEKGERNTKYFLSLEKRNASRKSIQYIEHDGNVIDTVNEVLDQFSNIYEEKYSANDQIRPDTSFMNCNIKNKLSTKEKKLLEENIQMSELTNALQSMKKGKTPGSNGFPVEFFRQFWNEIGPFLYRAVNNSIENDISLPTHREGIITLIPKTGKSPHSFKGWRPITLLNTDYKIISTVIANRIKIFMGNVINPAQTAYTAGRYIGENTRLAYDLIHWMKLNKKSGMIVAFDFESAFESVAWNYMKLVISSLDVGPYFQNIINYLYFNSNNYSRILLNGFLGNKIFLRRGIRQGDPASGYLFNIAVSLLTEQIIRSTRLSGINIQDRQEIRISQYADDTILFLDGSERSLKGAITEFDEFGRQSGLKINIEKTSCMWIGNTPENTINIEQNITFTNELKILGITINNDLTNIADVNLSLKIPTIKKEIEQWNRRYLTPVGKICVVKALLLSKLVHLFIALPNPSAKFIKELENILFRFIWSNKNDKIKRTKLIQQHSKDGLNMVHIESFIYSMKLTWLKRLCSSRADWTWLAAQELPEAWRLLSYGASKLKTLKSNSMNPFYADVLQALIKFNEEYCPSIEEIISENIYCTEWTKYRTTRVQTWEKRGLQFIGNLFNQNTGNIHTKEDLSRIYGIRMTFLCYASLIRSLPQNIRKQINKSFIKNPNIPFKINLVQNCSKFAKYAYCVFVQKKESNNKHSNVRLKSKWNADISGFAEGSMQRICTATLSSVLIYCHFRIINRIYATNKFLFHIKILDKDTCTFCKVSIETIVHLFWECSRVQIFIKEVLSHLKLNYGFDIKVTKCSWFFLENLDNMEIIIVTLMKQHIHLSRLDETKPSIEKLMRQLKDEVTKECNMAKINNKQDLFERKWGLLKNITLNTSSTDSPQTSTDSPDNIR